MLSKHYLSQSQVEKNKAPIADRHNPIAELGSHVQMEAARKSRAWRLGTLILLLERQAFTMCLCLSSLTSFMNWPPALCKACWGLCPQTPAQAHSLMFIHFSLSTISNSKQHSSWVYSSTCLTIQQHIKIFISHSFQLLFSSSYPHFQLVLPRLGSEPARRAEAGRFATRLTGPILGKVAVPMTVDST